MATYVNTLIKFGFRITNLEEPKPEPDISDPDVQDQSRRPPFLLVASVRE